MTAPVCINSEQRPLRVSGHDVGIERMAVFKRIAE
jgi:hypothetical protein